MIFLVTESPDDLPALLPGLLGGAVPLFPGLQEMVRVGAGHVERLVGPG